MAVGWKHFSPAFALALSACTAAASHGSVPPVRSPWFGFSAPVLVQDASFRWRWVAACFALRDTNGDGSLEVTVDHHGGTFGDDLQPFLLFDGQAPERVDQYIGASPDHRFVAVVSGARLFVIDARTQLRLDLSALGANLGTDINPAFTHPAIGFSEDGRAAFVRRSSSGSAVVLVELPSGTGSVAFRTEEVVSRFVLSADRLKVRLLPSGIADTSIHTNLAGRHCHGQAASFTVFRTGPDPSRIVEIPIARSRSPLTLPENVHAVAYECTSDGAPGLASSNGESLVAATAEGFHAERGPLAWTNAELLRNTCH